MDNYMDSTSPEYVRRMAASLDAKWEAIAPYVTPGARVLDYGCGMPVLGGIRERVEAAGGVYECHDISATVETALRDAGAAFRTREDLQERAGGYDVVFLSSVMHEILAGESWFEDLEFIRDLAAPGGVLIVRDWAGPNYQIDNEDPKSLKVVSEDAMREVLTWIGALAINKIVHFKGRCTHPVNWDTLEIEADPTSLYEIAFHSVWGLDSLPRESTEPYSQAYSILTTAIRWWREYEPEGGYDEWDETYLEHFQRLYDIDRLPWPTKTVLVLRRTK